MNSDAVDFPKDAYPTDEKTLLVAFATQEAEIALLREAVSLLLSEDFSRNSDPNQEAIQELRMQLGEHLLTKAKNAAFERRLMAAAESERRTRGLLGAQLLRDARAAIELVRTVGALNSMAEERNDLRRDVENLREHLASNDRALVQLREHLSIIYSHLDRDTLDRTTLSLELARISQLDLWRPNEESAAMQEGTGKAVNGLLGPK